jgi:6-phosphogluconolactonase
MRIEILPDAEAAARQAAVVIAEHAREAIATRGRFILALSGGETPRRMLHHLAAEDVSWADVYIVQVDERIAPAGDADRNLTMLQKTLLAHTPLALDRVLAMPVEANDPATAARRYAQALEILCGSPPVIDLVHLGLGADGHTASLVPGDPVLDVTDTDAAITNAYHGRRRMTLTYPIINRARCILWLVTGNAKAEMLARLCSGDTRIPAGRIQCERAVVLADQAASD